MSYTLITVARCKCDRPKCGKTFITKTEVPPNRCPYCGSKKWDVKGYYMGVDLAGPSSIGRKPDIDREKEFRDKYINGPFPEEPQRKTDYGKPELQYEKE